MKKSKEASMNVNEVEHEKKFDEDSKGTFLRKTRMEKESSKLDNDLIHGKVRNTGARKIIQSQNMMLSSLLGKGEKTMIKIEYFDTMLSVERRIHHLNKLFSKIKLRVIHKPFIILDMLKIMGDDRSSVNMFVSMSKKLINMRKRNGLDTIINFVEHKKEIIDNLANITSRLKQKRKMENWTKIENEQIRKQKSKRKIQRMKRGLKFFGIIVINMIRDRGRVVFSQIYRTSLERGRDWGKQEEDLNIAGQQGFSRGKEEVNIQNQWEDREFSKKKEEDKEDESSFNHQFEVRPNQMNAYFHKKDDNKANDFMSGEIKKKGDYESSFEDVDDTGLQRFQIALNQGNVDPTTIINRINSEMDRIGARLSKDELNEKIMSLQEKIEMLTQLTNLMQLLKKYFESLKGNKDLESHKVNKKNFEQILILLQKLIERLLQRMSSNLLDPSNMKSRDSSHHLEESPSADEERQRVESDPNSMAQIQILNQNLTKEMESLVNLVGPDKEVQVFDQNKGFDQDKGFESYKNPNYGTNEVAESGDEFRSVSGINGLLHEMMQNLNNMNQNIDNSNSTQQTEKCILYLQSTLTDI